MTDFFTRRSEKLVIYLILSVGVVVGLLILFNFIPSGIAAIPYFVTFGISLLLTFYYGNDGRWAGKLIQGGNDAILSEVASNLKQPSPIRGRTTDIETFKNLIIEARESIYIWRGDFSAIDEVIDSLRTAINNQIRIRILMNISNRSFKNAEKILSLSAGNENILQIRHFSSKIRGEIYDLKKMRLINKVGKEMDIGTGSGERGSEHLFWYTHYLIEEQKGIQKVIRLWDYCWKHSDTHVEAKIRIAHGEVDEQSN